MTKQAKDDITLKYVSHYNINNNISGSGNYPSNIPSEATILLYGEIGGDMGINGAAFANELQWLEAQGIQKCQVRINSPGGSVLEGWSIFSAILNTNMQVETWIDGMAASIAGIIAVAGTQVHMASHGLLMLHNPALPGQDDADTEVLDKIRNSLITIYTERRGQDANDIAAMMDRETWLDASEAKEMGLIDEVFDNARMPKLDPSLADARALYLIANQFLTINMDKNNNNPSSLDALKAENEQLKQQIQDLEQENQELKAKCDEQGDTMAQALVDAAIKEGTITPDVKDNWLKLAKSDPDNARKAIAALKPGTLKSAARISTALATNRSSNGREAWTIRDWEKKDPKGLLSIKELQPEVYQNMYNQFYKRPERLS